MKRSTVRRTRKPKGNAAVVLRMGWCCTDPEIAEFLHLSPRTVEWHRAKLGLRKYHPWRTVDFAILRTAKRNGYTASSVAPSLHVSPGALYKAAQRNPQLAA